MKQGSAADRESLGGGVSLFVRLWTYGGPSQPLTGLDLDQDAEIKELIRGITFGKGSIVLRRPDLLILNFDNAGQALSMAKDLQQRFLTFQRKSEPHQVVPSILIAKTKIDNFSGEPYIPEDLLANSTSAQILVSEPIYEHVKNLPGFKFGSKPVREAGGTGGPEAIQELLWTDESTYGHLRQASRGGLKTVGRYEIQEELGRGAMGVVYKAYDQLIGRTVALKTIEINRNTPDREDLIERLKQEAKAAGGLDHPNIITIYDVGEEDDLIYLSMQFLEGKTLSAVLAEPNLPPLPTLFSYADQILSAVGFAHARGVIHRDLKPANLMLTTKGVIKVLDFGIAKVENASLTQTGLVVGTPSHMAPEQVAGKKVDHRADIFALGSVFYELVTHEKPFRGDVTTILYKIMHEDPVAPSLINPSLPGGIDAIIRKALAKEPNERFQSCEEMRQAFLEQAGILDVKPAAAAPAVVAAKPAARAGAVSPNYLLEEVVAKKSGYLWLNLAIIAVLALGGTTVWAFYTRSNTGVFPPLVQKLVAAFHRDAPPSMEGKTESALSQPTETDKNTSSGDPGSAGSATSPTKTTDAGAPAASGESSTSASAQTAATPSTPNLTVNDKAQGTGDNNRPSPGAAPVSPSASPTPTAAQLTAPGSLVPDKVPASGAVATPAQGTAQGSEQAKSASPAESDNTGADQSTAKPVKKTAPAAPLYVDGFSRRDVPELLRQADAAAGRNDYRLARYEYALILKLDPTNATARAALRKLPVATRDRP